MNKTTSILLRYCVAVLTLAAAIGTPFTLAADVTDLGFVDQLAIASTPSFQAANRQLQAYNDQLQRQFSDQVRHTPAQQQAALAQSFQQRLAQRRSQLLGPLFGRAQVAIASVASSKNLSIVVDKRILIYGGQDITKNVVDLIAGVGEPVPPVNTPPPSTIGYVDQAAIDNVAKIKNAQDAFGKFQQDQQKAAQDKYRAAKTDADRQQVLKDLQKTISDEQDKDIKPLVDQTRSVIADVAKKKGLMLVIDRSNTIYGGTDITPDVVSALGK